MKPMRVLVADDNPIIQRLAILVLQALGHSGMAVRDGRQALQCLDENAFDFVLMDVSMPNMDGLDALRTIRANDLLKGTHTRVIMCTAHDLPDDRRRFIALGADGYIAKPIDAHSLKLELELARVSARSELQ